MNEFYRNKRVLITGHKGFIGRALAQRIADLGGVVIGLDRCNCDVADIDAVWKIFQRDKPNVVFHLAAQTEVGTSFSSPYATYRTNVGGTLAVLECCRKLWVESVVVASSDKAYGQFEKHELPYRETYALRGNADVYSNSKKMADDLCHHYGRTYGMPIRVLRCANVYGPGQTNPTTLITRTITNLLKGGGAEIHEGARTTVREWLFIEDAVNAYLFSGKDAVKGPIKDVRQTGEFAINVGSGVVKTVSEVVVMIARMMELQEITTQDVYNPNRQGQINDQMLLSDRLLMRMGERYLYSFETCLAKTIAWHREQQ